MENSFKPFFTFAIVYITRDSLPFLSIHRKLSFHQFEIVLVANLKVNWSVAVRHEFCLVA
jgi:hypothetical protein